MEHKLLSRHASNSSASDILLSTPSKIVQCVEKSSLSLPDVMSMFRAKIQRTSSFEDYYKISACLIDVLNAFPEENYLVFDLLTDFPELLAAFSTIIDYSAENITNILIPLSSNLCSRPLFSKSFSKYDLWNMVADFICHIISILPEISEENICNLSTFISRLDFSCQEDLFRATIIITKFTSCFKILNLSKSLLEPFGYSVCEYVFHAKTLHSSFDFSFLIKALFETVEIHSDFAHLFFTHPIFSENEMISFFISFAPQPSTFREIAVYFLVADYPYLDEKRGVLLENILTNSSKENIPAKPLATDILQGEFALLLKSFLNLQFDFSTISCRKINLNLASIAFACFSQKALYHSSFEAIQSMADLVHQFPIFAQRFFLLIPLVIRKCAMDEIAVQIIAKALIKVSTVDQFCQEHCLSIIGNFIKIDPVIRSIAIPTLAFHLPSHAHLFDLIKANLSPLLFAHADRIAGERSFAISVWYLTFSIKRQSHLQFALAAINSSLGKAALRDLSDPPKALLIHALCNLVNLQVVNPKLVWLNFIKPILSNINLSSVLALQCARAVGCLSLLLPEHEEDYPSADPTITDAIKYLLQNVWSIHPSQVFFALSNFPVSFLTFIEVDFYYLFVELLSTDTSLESMDLSVSTAIDAEVEKMPRSLYLGTGKTNLVKREKIKLHDPDTGFLRSKLSSWNTNPVLAAINFDLSISENVIPILTECTNLPSLSLQHWFLRIFFIQGIFQSIDLYFAQLQDSDTFEKDMQFQIAAYIDKIKNGQTVSSVSYGIILAAALVANISKYSLNQRRLCEMIEDLLSDKLVPLRFVNNEEVQASILIAVFNLHFHLSDTNKKGEVDEMVRISKLGTNAAADSWIGFWRSLILESDSWAHSLYFGQNSSSIILSKEPFTFPNLFTFIDASQKEKLSSLIDQISVPGPVMRKISSCISLVGLFHFNHIEKEEAVSLLAPLTKAASECTDNRLLIWLLLLVHYATKKCHIITDDSPLHQNLAIPRTDYNRFAFDSILGACIDYLSLSDGRTEVKEMICKGLQNCRALPLLDWSFVEPSLLTTDLVLKHFRQTYNQKKIFQRQLVLEVYRLIEQIILPPNSSLFLDLWDASCSDQELLVRWIDLLRLNYDEGMVAVILESNPNILGNGQVQALLCEQDSISVNIWKVITSSAHLLVNESLQSLNDMLQHLNLVTFIDELEKRPILSNLLASWISNHSHHLLNLSNLFLICLEDVEGRAEVIANLMIDTLLAMAPDYLSSCKDRETRVKLEWIEFCLKDGKSAMKIASRLSKVEPLLGPYDLLHCLLSIPPLPKDS